MLRNFVSSKVILFSIFSFVLFLQSVNAANLKLSPSSGTYKVGQSFSVDVLITNNTDNINGASATINFSNDSLEVKSVSKVGSILTIWAEEPNFSNATGKISLEGVLLNPGFTGNQAKVLTITFKAKSEGLGTVNISSGSVLANDGNGTNVLGSLGSASYNIDSGVDEAVEAPAPKATSNNSSPIIITSTTYPDSNKWYKDKNASFDWKLPSGATAVRTIYDDKESTLPNRVYDPPINNRAFVVDGDGTMYMSVQARVNGSWGKVSSYKFQVDTQSPEKLEISLPDGDITTSSAPSVLVKAEDRTSGIDSVAISVDGGNDISYKVESSSLYKLPKASSGKHTAVVTVFDKAGNFSKKSIEYTIQGINPPVITEYTKNVEVGGSLRVSGTTFPNVIVEVVLRDKKGNILSNKVSSDNNGLFILDWRDDLSTGVFDLMARAINVNGATSDYTEPKTVVIEHIALIRFGIFIMNWLSLILMLIIALVAIIATFWYSFHQFAAFRKKVKRTIIEAEQDLRDGVSSLRKDTEEFHAILIKAEKKRNLTKEENMILKKFKKRLSSIQKNIEDELDRIK